MAGDIGHTIRVEETASNESGPGSRRPPNATAVVGTRADEHQTARTITGTAQQGQNSPSSTAMDKQPDRLHIQVAAVRQLGRQLHHDLRGHGPDLRAGGRRRRPHDQGRRDGQQRRRPGQSTSSATAVVKIAPPKSTKAPKITGTAQQGKNLTEDHGSGQTAPPASPTSGSSATAPAPPAPRSPGPRPDLRAGGRRRRPHDQGPKRPRATKAARGPRDLRTRPRSSNRRCRRTPKRRRSPAPPSRAKN